MIWRRVRWACACGLVAAGAVGLLVGNEIDRAMRAIARDR